MLNNNTRRPPDYRCPNQLNCIRKNRQRDNKIRKESPKPSTKMLSTTSLIPSCLMLQNDLQVEYATLVLFSSFLGCCLYLDLLTLKTVRWVQQAIKAALINTSHATRVLGFPLEYLNPVWPVLEIIKILDMLLFLLADLAELHGLELEGLL
ncbi:hypothetical protein PV10_08916 [Exophiala mesophila]|uniref:Uncharacterized protein n=1 Tax=Exophiala mesophila TaxID=212818 RepID=A0A0D1XMH0_EXOME|nr:uncharacterized protein PV10_08916 [Exophiala mesophila]KIV89341.1 hypothetical protein PV10_08916 [Exophiala mesophila]